MIYLSFRIILGYPTVNSAELKAIRPHAWNGKYPFSGLSRFQRASRQRRALGYRILMEVRRSGTGNWYTSFLVDVCAVKSTQPEIAPGEGRCKPASGVPPRPKVIW